MGTFTAVANAIKFVLKLIELFEKLGNFIGERKLDSWVNDLEKTVDDLKKAKTPNEKLSAAERMSRLIRGLD